MMMRLFKQASLRHSRSFATQRITPVCIDFNDLKGRDVDLSESIEKAFGFEGIGLVTVKNVPGVLEAREALLPLSYHLAALPSDVLTKYERPETYYGFGWSHGKEKLQGKPDFAKGSFYANPQYDEPTKDKDLIKRFPSYCSPNTWPQEELPMFKPCFKALGRLIVEVGLHVAKHTDLYVTSKVPDYEFGKLNKIIATSLTAKGRLLHYFPLTSKEAMVDTGGDDDISSWCGWHNDHGALTGLTSSMYLDRNGMEVPSPDEHAGLYIKTRQGGVVQAVYPADQLAFQIGEAAQIHSGGVLQATPHAVRGAKGENAIGVSRSQLAVFMQPMWGEDMGIPDGTTFSDACKGSSSEFLPEGMPCLEDRWEPSYDFGTFTNATLDKYH